MAASLSPPSRTTETENPHDADGPRMELRTWREREDLRDALAVRERTLRVGYRGVVDQDLLEAAAEEPDDAAVDALADAVEDEAGALVLAELGDDDGVGDGTSDGVGTGADEPAADPDAGSDREVVGYVRARYGATSDYLGALDAEIVELYVDPAHWRQGVGTRLLEAAGEWTPPNLRGTGAELLAANERGRAFLEANGFAVEGTGETTFGGETLEAVRYRRERE